MMDLLTPDEFAASREPEAFYRSCQESEMETRFLLIRSRGLEMAYARDAIVHAAFQPYITGRSTWQGSLLLAYRALLDKHGQMAALAHEYERPVLVAPIPLLTLAEVGAAHVLMMVDLCNDMFRLASEARQQETPEHFARRVNQALGIDLNRAAARLAKEQGGRA